MDTTTINVLVNVPKSYSIELLKEQLTAYAQQLISAAKPAAKAKGRYRHEALCGIFNSDATEDQLIEDYLQEKYKLWRCFQHQCAIQNKCDAFVTINLRDYSNADTSKMKILSPTEFVEKYL